MKISKLITRKTYLGVSNAFIVEAEIDSDKDDLLERLCKSVTNWIKFDTAGSAAWEYSGHDFNIGDLASHLGDSGLIQYMAFYGIRGFNISDVPEEDPRWYYDVVLANVADLEEVCH